MMKMQYHMSDTGTDAILRFIKSLFPAGNAVPPSLYLAKKIMDVKSGAAAACEVGVGGSAAARGTAQAESCVLHI